MMRRIFIAAAVTWATLVLVAAFAWLRHPAQSTAASTTPTVVVVNGSGTSAGTSGQIAAVSQTAATAHATTRTS